VVAVKVVAPELAANATARRRFLREVRAAAAVSHDHVVTIYVVEENVLSKDSRHAPHGGPPYLAMEFIDGQSLEQNINRAGRLEVKEVLRIGRQVVRQDSQRRTSRGSSIGTSSRRTSSCKTAWSGCR
jgi:serine/threonine protein kinase